MMELHSHNLTGFKDVFFAKILKTTIRLNFEFNSNFLVLYHRLNIRECKNEECV
jgi:hypothetical protein